jgi:hypothetical protein
LLTIASCILDRDYYEYLGTALYNLRRTGECNSLNDQIGVPKAI